MAAKGMAIRSAKPCPTDCRSPVGFSRSSSEPIIWGALSSASAT